MPCETRKQSRETDSLRSHGHLRDRLHGPRFRAVNDAVRALTGYERDELLAMDPSDFLDDESRAAFAERIPGGLPESRSRNSLNTATSPGTAGCMTSR